MKKRHRLSDVENKREERNKADERKTHRTKIKNQD